MAALASSLASSVLTGTPLSSSSPARSSSVRSNGGPSMVSIQCSSHPQKKATAHHNKSRPKKSNPYDKNRRGPTVYERLPKPPPIWGFDTSDLEQTEEAPSAAPSAAPSSAPAEA